MSRKLEKSILSRDEISLLLNSETSKMKIYAVIYMTFF